jgi:hypothetical protein
MSIVWCLIRQIEGKIFFGAYKGGRSIWVKSKGGQGQGQGQGQRSGRAGQTSRAEQGRQCQEVKAGSEVKARRIKKGQGRSRIRSEGQDRTGKAG